MVTISEHFSREEFACSDSCGFEAVDVELLGYLEKIRNHYNKPVNITNACRCLEKNRSVGSKDTSQHVRGLAADIWIYDVDPEELANYIDTEVMPGRGGIGIYPNFVHLDCKSGKMRRWKKT